VFLFRGYRLLGRALDFIIYISKVEIFICVSIWKENSGILHCLRSDMKIYCVKSIISATYIFLDLTNKDKKICILSYRNDLK